MFLPSEHRIITEEVSRDTVRDRKSPTELNVPKRESDEEHGAALSQVHCPFRELSCIIHSVIDFVHSWSPNLLVPLLPPLK